MSHKFGYGQGQPSTFENQASSPPGGSNSNSNNNQFGAATNPFDNMGNNNTHQQQPIQGQVVQGIPSGAGGGWGNNSAGDEGTFGGGGGGGQPTTIIVMQAPHGHHGGPGMIVLPGNAVQPNQTIIDAIMLSRRARIWFLIDCIFLVLGFLGIYYLYAILLPAIVCLVAAKYYRFGASAIAGVIYWLCAFGLRIFSILRLWTFAHLGMQEDSQSLSIFITVINCIGFLIEVYFCWNHYKFVALIKDFTDEQIVECQNNDFAVCGCA